MNARTERIHLEVLNSQIPDTVQSIFHTLLLLRSTGKFSYKDECTYSIEPLSIKDQSCDFLDLTYARVDSDELDRYLQQEIEQFVKPLRSSDFTQSCDITLTFYQKKQKRWPFAPECIPWEIWNLDLTIINLPNEHERNAYRTSLGMMVGDKLMYIAEVMSRDQFMPKNPNKCEIDNVFNTAFPSIQPYLFKIDHSQSAQGSTYDTLRKIIKDALKASSE